MNSHPERLNAIKLAMLKIPPEHRFNWCPGGPCMCVCCVNVHHGLEDQGFTREDWRAWVLTQADQRTVIDPARL